jgi:type II secretory pathway component GspD/PulD (secretin)
MRRMLLLLLVLWATGVQAGGQMEIMHLKHRAAADVIEVLRPLVEQGGSISGLQDKIIVRASAANRAQIRAALAAVDTAPRRLMITVKQDNTAGGHSASGGVSGSLGRSGSLVHSRVWSSRGAASDRASQQVQVIEGGQAFIEIGYSFPLPLRQVVFGPGGAMLSESVVYRDIGSGFYALPRLNGDQVTLEISPQQQSVSLTDAGAVRSSRLSTTVRGPLGEWMAIGGANRDSAGDHSGGLSYSTRASLDTRRVLLKVEELR